MFLKKSKTQIEIPKIIF